MNNYYPFVNEPLPYPYDSLEPYIDCKTMTLHHQKHLQTYIDKLNALLKENPSLQKLSLPQLLVNLPLLPSSIQVPLQNNAGGVYNHRFFFYSMHQPNSSPVPEDVMEKSSRISAVWNLFMSNLSSLPYRSLVPDIHGLLLKTET